MTKTSFSKERVYYNLEISAHLQGKPGKELELES